ncbi:MAG: 7-cyano-7-deazaguanine synthase [Chloroflexota bacterium]|nr:7-cyano-7-deazaguanine synthase [Chloroflexota bacterium]
MTSGRTTRALCVCDGATVPVDLAGKAFDHRLEITTRGKDPELNFVVEDLLGKLSGRMAPRVQDLLSLAAYCFAADRMVRRGGPIDVHREGWRRELVLCLPVADPAFWSQPALMRLLTETLDFGTDDRWTFHFTPVERPTPQVEITWDDHDLLEQPDTVVLFSGGTDSLCGVVEAVRQGARPVLVSHWAADHVRARQQRLRAAVRHELGGWEFPLVQVELHRRDQQDGESSQRTRGFLFACLGAAVAAHLRVATVLLPENGYVSISPRINDQLVGALASRGTHPKFLALFNRFIHRVFDGTVEVTNPLWNRTRAEALATLKDAGYQALLRQTYSCGKMQGRSRGKPNCGGCSQCIDRRFAVIAAGLDEHDLVDRYEFDLFAEQVPEGEARTVALSYLRFAEELRPLDPEAILDQRRELDVCVDPDDPGADRQFLDLAAMLQRHATEALAVMEQMYARHARELANRTVEPESLLLLWQPVSPRRPADTDAAVHPDPGGGQDGDGVRFGVPLETHRSRFERFGQVWMIEFRDEKSGLTNRVGVQRLARILKTGESGLEALDLVTGSGVPRRKTRSGDGESLQSSRQGSVGTVLDADAIKAYRARRDELDREIKVKTAAGKLTEAAQLQHEHDWIDRELKQWVGKHEKPRAFPEEHEAARQTVSKTVWGEVRALKTDMPLLVAHLETFVHLAYLCWYAPDPPEDWAIEL